MPGNPNPAVAPYTDRNASEIIAYEKLYVRKTVADVAAVRNGDWTGQFGGLYVASLTANFRIDTSITDLDDGANILIDAAGNHWARVVDSATLTQRTVTAAGDVAVASDDVDQINLKKTVGAATRVILPLSSARAKPVRIVDRKYDASTNNITIVPKRPTTITMTIATPAVVGWTAHGRAADDPFSLESSGLLPTGADPDTVFYVLGAGLAADSFRFAATPGGAAINTTGSQSGVHKAGTDVVMGAGKFTIDSNGASLQLTPLTDQTGWS